MIARKLIAYGSKPRITQRLASNVRSLSSVSKTTSVMSRQQDLDDTSFVKLNHKDWLAPNEVLKIFDNLKDPNLLIPVYEQYSTRKDYKPTEYLYILVIQKLGKAKKFDEIEEIMKRIDLERRCRLSEEFFYTVIRVYGNLAGRINRAIDTLFSMPKFGCWPSVKTFNFVLNLLVSAKLFDVVHEIFVSAPKLSVEIDACSLNILIKGLCESGNLEAAHQVLDEFPKRNFQPNVKTFSSLMRGLCDKGRVDEAFELLKVMEKEEIDPDTITFNILISGLRKQGRVDEGMQLLQKMQLIGCEPNPASFQEVLYGLINTKRFPEGKEFMSRMIFLGMSPSFVSYKGLIQGLCEEKLVSDVDWVLKEMVRHEFVPKMGTWRQVMWSLFSGNIAIDFAIFDHIVNG